MKIHHTIIILLVLLCPKLSAQHYTRSVGVRGGYTSGITYRHNMNDNGALEGIIKIGINYSSITILKQHFMPNQFGISERLYLGMGYGLHAGYRYGNHYKTLYRDFIYPARKAVPIIGFDGYIGTEYRIDDFPLTVGLDCKPFFEFSTRQIFRLYLPDIAFTLKYRF